MELTAAVWVLLKGTANAFHGAQRRRCLAETVEALGLSQRQAERPLGWARETLRKAQHALHAGSPGVDNCSARGRKPAAFHVPALFPAIRVLVRDPLQTDPPVQTTPLSCRRSAPEVRKQRSERTGSTDQQLPSVQPLAAKRNRLGGRLRTVATSRPPKE